MEIEEYCMDAGMGESLFWYDMIFKKRLREGGGAWRVLEDTIARAGLEKWPRLFNNLRASCIMDYDDLGYSEKTLNSIFGNSERIRRKHYISFRRDKEFMTMLGSRLHVVDLLSSLGGTLQNGVNETDNIDLLIRKLESLKVSQKSFEAEKTRMEKK